MTEVKCRSFTSALFGDDSLNPQCFEKGQLRLPESFKKKIKNGGIAVDVLDQIL